MGKADSLILSHCRIAGHVHPTVPRSCTIRSMPNTRSDAFALEGKNRLTHLISCHDSGPCPPDFPEQLYKKSMPNTLSYIVTLVHGTQRKTCSLFVCAPALTIRAGRCAFAWLQQLLHAQPKPRVRRRRASEGQQSCCGHTGRLADERGAITSQIIDRWKLKGKRPTW